MSNTNVTTPHAAVLIWNYNDRITGAGATVGQLDTISEVIISTVSCRQIQTSKSKSQPDGTFNFVLAPTKNWIEEITPGSWCCILMGNTPITKADLTKANKKQVKMIGKIESVRAEVTVDDEGARQTTFNVTGVDWGHIFQCVLYIDNLIASANDPANQGNLAAVVIRNALFGADGGGPAIRAVVDNLRSIIGVFGQPAVGLTKAGEDINRLAKAVYNFRIPKEMVDFFSFVNEHGPSNSQLINNILSLQTGRLVGIEEYDDTQPEALGYIDPFSLQGTNTFWQILLENSNPALNEMFCEMTWDNEDPSNNDVALTLFNRIKPFSFNDTDPNGLKNLRSYFKNLRTHYIQTVGGDIDPVDVMSINAGTNWRDKYNFVEIKPNFSEFKILGNWSAQKCQDSDAVAFEREGFRPYIVGTKQFPYKGDKTPTASNVHVDFDQLLPWVKLLREWFFDTHRMLNGTITLHGIDDYIAVGDNIRFEAGLLNPTPNINQATFQAGQNQFILAHVENVSHSFTVVNGDTRSYVTTIQFVRGIVVNSQNVLTGAGALDEFTTSLPAGAERNTNNVFGDSDPETPGGS